MPYLPGLVVSFAFLAAAGIHGSWGFASVVAVAAIPSLLLSCILIFLVTRKRPPVSVYGALALGLGLYLLSAGGVLVLLNQLA